MSQNSQNLDINTHHIPQSIQNRQYHELSKELVAPSSQSLLALPTLLPHEVDQLLEDNEYLIKAVKSTIEVMRLESAYQYYKKLQSNLNILLYHCETYLNGTYRAYNRYPNESTATGTTMATTEASQPLASSTSSSPLVINRSTFEYAMRQIDRARALLGQYDQIANHLKAIPTPPHHSSMPRSSSSSPPSSPAVAASSHSHTHIERPNNGD